MGEYEWTMYQIKVDKLCYHALKSVLLYLFQFWEILSKTWVSFFFQLTLYYNNKWPLFHFRKSSAKKVKTEEPEKKHKSSKKKRAESDEDYEADDYEEEEKKHKSSKKRKHAESDEDYEDDDEDDYKPLVRITIKLYIFLLKLIQCYFKAKV